MADGGREFEQGQFAAFNSGEGAPQRSAKAQGGVFEQVGGLLHFGNQKVAHLGVVHRCGQLVAAVIVNLENGRYFKLLANGSLLGQYAMAGTNPQRVNEDFHSEFFV